MRYLPRLEWAVVGAALALGGHVDGSAQEPAATYGSRLPPLPPGEGGDLVVTAPSQLCVDDGYELQVRRYKRDTWGIGMLYVLRGPAGPSLCRWEVNGLRSSTYDAVIRRRRDDQIVAAAPQQSVAPGGLGELRVEFAQVELEGTVNVNGQPAADSQLFVQAGQGFNKWQVPLREDGFYHVTLPGSDSGSFCIYLQRAMTQSIGMVHVGCERFAPGFRRFDADLHVPPGVIRVEVLPFGTPVSNDWTAVNVFVVRRARSANSAAFKVTRGFRGEYFGGDFGEYDVTVRAGPDHRILARSVVVLSAEHPVADVRLAIPTGSLGCHDGWWSAC